MNMHITVTATEANRSFAKLLREVGKGKRVTITSHSQPVATLAPVEDEAALRARQLALLDKLEKRKAGRKFVAVGAWTREELYAKD